MQYTELRGRVYWFRRRAPAPLSPGMVCLLDRVPVRVGQNGYVRLSLDTTDRRLAAKKARKLAHLVDEAAERVDEFKASAKSESPGYDDTPPTREEILRAADLMYAQLLGADESVAEASVAALIDGQDDEVREADRYTWTQADLPPATTAGQLALLRKLGPVISFFLQAATKEKKIIQRVTPELLPFADSFRRYVAVLERRRMGEVVPTPQDVPAGPAWSWQDAYNYYLEQRGELSKGTQYSYRIAWETLAKSARGIPATLTRAAIVAWRDASLKQLDPKTVQDRLTAAKAIWRESQINEKLPGVTIDPFDRLRVKIDPNARGARQEFSADELKQIFSAPPAMTHSAVSMHAGYWLPLLALYHGARLEELTGLEVADLEPWEGGLILHIRENTIRPRLKSRKRSERSIPVHSEVIRLGFKNYVEAAKVAGIQALFPSFSTGATFGETFVEYVKGLLNPMAGRLVGMHCLRHNWETARRNGLLDSSAAAYITGRRLDPGSAGLYGGPAGRKVLKKELAKIRYDGLSHLAAPDITPQELKNQETKALRRKRKKLS